MELTGALQRRHTDGHFFGPQDAFCGALLAAASASPPHRLVYFKGLLLGGEEGGGLPHHGCGQGGPGHRCRGGACPLPALRHVAGGARRAGRVTDCTAVSMAYTGQSGNATKSTSWLLWEPPGGLAPRTLGRVPIPL